MSVHIGSASPAALALANPWAVVPSLGNLDAYITAANRMPMLTLEEEQASPKTSRQERS
jgi:RNA polymerase sigma-32 factor